MAAELPEIEDEKPLDPAVEAVRRKLARLLLVSIGIMMAGVLSVLGAIVYKINARSAAQTASGTLTLPAGATILDQSSSDDRLVLRLKLANGTERMAVFSLADGQKTADWAITALPE